jgi:hypothetical protein
LLLLLFRDDDDVMNGVSVRLFMDIAIAGSKIRTMAVSFYFGTRTRIGKLSASSNTVKGLNCE